MPDRSERLELIRALENARGGTKVISYVTSTRTNLEAQMAMDAIPILHQHLAALGTPREKTKVDLLIHSNGGDGIVPWRAVTLIREYAKDFSVLVPHRAFSAATLMALGADKVIMHPMGMLGPTDPTVTHPLNPPNPQNPSQPLGISVEDVASYINLVKEDVGIRHEEEVVQAFAHLADKVHPLALGSVKRGTAQSRLIAEKLLGQRVGEDLSRHDLDEIIQKLTSTLYYHGHPINRNEARDDLRLGFVEDATPQVEEAMWNLYSAYAEEIDMEREFQPVQEAYAVQAVDLPPPPQMGAPGQIGATTIGIQNVPLGPFKTAFIESTARTDYTTVEFHVTLRREWTGELQGNVALIGSRWESET